ncbi:hypothetical protein E4U55_000512 [Claviceps digitariae]|nr:hypothetical protein E4U55_000512 [Claviceps digitariae]
MLSSKITKRFRYWQPKHLIRFLTSCLVLALITCTLWHNWCINVYRTKTQSNVYAFYAHDDTYACSVLVNAHILRNVLRTRYRIVAMVSDGISPAMREALVAHNITIVPDTPLPLHSTAIAYYQGCLLKLAAFKLHHFDPSIQRVLVMDADQLVLQNLDDLFDRNPAAEFMAPTAYWLSNDTISSTCMLIRPSDAGWERVKAAAANITSGKYDMDLINELFGAEDPTQTRLESKYITLNSHWEDWNLPAWFEPEAHATHREHRVPSWFDETGRQVAERNATSLEMHALQDQVAILHFTAVDKPWMHDTAGLRLKQPNAHPIFVQQWRTWRSLAMQECPAGTVEGI